MSKKEFLLALLFLVSSVAATTAQTSRRDPAAAIERGNSSFAKEDYETAIREYASVPANAGENHALALYNIGVSYYELWRTAEAIAHYRLAIAARHGHYPRASYALGVALEDQGQLIEAKEAYEQSIARSEYGPAHYRLGLLAARKGDSEAAAESFRKALSLPGLHVPASHNNLGVMLARLGRLSEAQRAFEAALEQTGGDFDDAVRNLKLCRSLLAEPSTRVAAFRVSEVIAEPDK